ncbi:EF-hand domain-containing protein [Sorangium sp. So ce1097]|uniref:EF-hand domain-containing protein n=1 Tax=Sorangium sp. So ce1097 TaxID=3133330 RepID=UPI003F5F703F
MNRPLFSNMARSAIRRLVLGTFLSAAVLAGSGAAYAASSTEGTTAPRHDKGARREHRPRDPAQMIKRLDKNGDGKLTVAELPEKAQKRLAKADTNKDGVLSAEELKAHAELRKKDRAAKQKERFARKDKNGDGFLTKDEVGDKRWERFKAADANRDNKVSADELRAAHAARKQAGKHPGKQPAAR